MIKTRIRNTKSNKKKYIVLGVGVCVFLAVLLILELTGVTNFYQKTSVTKTDTTSATGKRTVNYDPPTKEEQEAGDKQKQTNVEQEENQTTTLPATAQVVVTDAAQYDAAIEVRAFISNVYENGTCTFEFKQGASVVKKDTQATKDATTTICNNPLIARSEFPSSGDWQFTVSYSSNAATGKSATQIVKVK